MIRWEGVASEDLFIPLLDTPQVLHYINKVAKWKQIT